MVETYTYQQVFSQALLDKYTFMESRAATHLINSLSFKEMQDIIDVLERFSLNARLLLTKGGNKGPVPTIFDAAFAKRGWIEARVDLYRRAYFIKGHSGPSFSVDPFGEEANAHVASEIYQVGYAIDNVKGRIALDIEWNSKDGNLDRDFAAYRAWHEEGIIDACVLITRMHDETKRLTDEAWSNFIDQNPSFKHEAQPVSFKTSTTANFEKAKERILRGDLGTCPILVVGIGQKCFDNKPWDGLITHYNKNTNTLTLQDAFGRVRPENGLLVDGI